MARVKEIPLGRSHQMAICRYARRVLSGRPGGMVLADGVGLGKTYEALGTVASLLSQLLHRRERKRQQPFKVLVLVPPRLVSKWADELLLPDGFPRYLKAWRSSRHNAVVQTFSDIVVLRRHRDLERRPGERRYGRIELPPGMYVVNSNLLRKEGHRVTQIYKTRWHAIIVDEAHHIARDLFLPPYTLLAGPKTKTLLLTATPFQLSPQEMRELLAATFGGLGVAQNWNSAFDAAEELYRADEFRGYRTAINSYFRKYDAIAAREAARLRGAVRRLLLPRIVRNRKMDNRRYHFVDAAGNVTPLKSSPFKLDEDGLNKLLNSRGLIELDPTVARTYVVARDQLAEAAVRKTPVFVAGALRQLLSSWDQFRKSSFGRYAKFRPPPGPHPKLAATVDLVARLLEGEFRHAADQGWVGKILIFTTYVGADTGQETPLAETAHGTAAALKRALTKRLAVLYFRARESLRQRIRDALLAIVDGSGSGLTLEERRRLEHVLRNFSGSPPAAIMLKSKRNLREEARELKRLLKGVEVPETHEQEFDDEEMNRRLRERRERRIRQILDRYSTRDLVARYDGATRHEERDRHLRGFNSPYAPLVLIASSVGQEGIDLQQYCRHVLHYDLEWNPAKLEQREGRVDREGRKAKGAVNVYFLLCRGTYDERVMHVMVNRFRWHHVLLANKAALEAPPETTREAYAEPRLLDRFALDLRPPRRLPKS